jgi:aryl-alcohol dehydrogenase-like predicted oxidoreductase
MQKRKLKTAALGETGLEITKQLRWAQRIAPVETLRPPYSLINRAAEEELLPFAERKGIGVIVYSPMGSGLLTGALTRASGSRACRRTTDASTTRAFKE